MKVYRKYVCKICDKTFYNALLSIRCHASDIIKPIAKSRDLTSEDIQIGNVFIIEKSMKRWYDGNHSWVYKHLPNGEKLFYYVLTTIEDIPGNGYMLDRKKYHFVTKEALESQISSNSKFSRGWTDNLVGKGIKIVENVPIAIDREKQALIGEKAAIKIV